MRNMSQNVKRNVHFIGLIIDTDKKQALYLLKTITDSQAQLIKEIAYNVESFLDIYPVLTSVVQRNKQLIKSLKKSKLPKTFIKRNNLKVLNFLNKIHPILRQLIK